MEYISTRSKEKIYSFHEVFLKGLAPDEGLFVPKKFPKYRWNKNFGYGTKDHLNGLKKYGITQHHRKKFKPIHNILFSKTRETQ